MHFKRRQEDVIFCLSDIFTQLLHYKAELPGSLCLKVWSFLRGNFFFFLFLWCQRD